MYSDLNGDSAANEGDIFGFACNYYPFAWLESFGIEMYEKEAPDSAVLTLDTKNERAYTLIDKLHTWFYSGENGVHVTMDDTREKRSLALSVLCSLFRCFHFSFGEESRSDKARLINSQPLWCSALPLR